jgi:putative transposase
MSRKNENPQKAAMREMMKNLLKDKELRIQNGSDFKNIMRDMMSVLLKGTLDDSLKTIYTNYDDMELEIFTDWPIFTTVR